MCLLISVPQVSCDPNTQTTTRTNSAIKALTIHAKYTSHEHLSFIMMATWQLMYAILMVFSREHLTFTMQPASMFPIRIASTASSACSSHQEIDALRRTTKCIIEGIPHTRPCSCGSAGWTRVAYLNMSDPQQTCPSNWNLNTFPVRGCGRSSTGKLTCDSVVYPVNGLTYSRVCGRIIAYHKSWSEGLNYGLLSSSIESAYVSGISLTHGPPGTRQHVWTFVGAENEQHFFYDNCPCAYANRTWPHPIPSFIGNDYFCETGRRGTGYNVTAFYLDDPLWDGEGCGSTSSCCEFNSPPWFCKFLPQPTTDDL